VFVRLFTGISLSEDVIAGIARVLDYLRPAAQLRWVPPYNLHVTTKFIGEWPENRLDEAIEALQPLSRLAPFEMAASGVGWLPNPHSPRVLFIGLKAGPELAQLAAATEDALAPLGIPKEGRKFTAHLTLARIRDTTPLAPLRRSIASLESTEFGSIRAESFHLYLSKPGPAGSIYTQLAEIPFSG
jgi:2'-5' RNA ligase